MLGAPRWCIVVFGGVVVVVGVVLFLGVRGRGGGMPPVYLCTPMTGTEEQ